jgi:nitrate reductase gamma subunit
MPELDNSQTASESWKTQALLAGAVIGALVGVGAAYLLTQRAERNQESLKISAGDGVKLGVLVFGLLRQVAQLGEGS